MSQNVTEQAQEMAGSFAVDPNIKHFFFEEFYAKRMSLPKGFFALSHAHKYSHMSVLSKGRARVITDDTDQIYEEGECIEIKAGVHHRIEALEDVTWFCIHDAGKGDIDEVLTGS